MPTARPRKRSSTAQAGTLPFSAPKSVSLTALVGGDDDRVREAHREAVTAALTELERYTQARIGGNNPCRNHGPVRRREVRARHRPPGRRLRRAPAPHPRCHLQRDRTRRWDDPRSPTAKSLRISELRDGGVSVRSHPSTPKSWLRNHARTKRRAGDQRIFAGVS